MSPMMVCAIGRMPPPPMPCSARAAIKAGIDGASAHATEPTTKMTMAPSIIRRRPWMSDSLPNNGVAAVLASRYAVTTQLKSSTSPSVRPMVGNAGATMVCSSAERNIASRMPIMMAWMVARGRGAVRCRLRSARRRSCARTMTDRAGNSTARGGGLPCG